MKLARDVEAEMRGVIHLSPQGVGPGNEPRYYRGAISSHPKGAKDILGPYTQSGL